ncbi:MAG: YkgJ family cysteine cluster protein [Candidatus Bathyarchaeota archaeon]|nr:YkgJ family cysteine cluster protein [Candidatus Bathyarchaeota archaeon]
MGFEYPADMCFDCVQCGLCCGDTELKMRRILLLKSDAEQIATQTKRQIGDFATETPDKAPYVYEMLKNPHDGKCVFLNSSGKCTIYEVRPLICRFYPFELSTNEQGEYVFKVTDECPGVAHLKDGEAEKKLSVDFFSSLLALARARFDAV